MLIAIYQPIVTRIELFRATRMWQKGVKATIAKYKECGAPRFYMLYDKSHKDFAIMTYDPNRKDMLAYRRLVQMGKWKASRYFKNVEDIKAASYYYTPSKWGAIGCDADNKVRAKKLKQWQEYYMYRVSTLMFKLRIYKKEHGID
ncbi:hypothetical protein DWV76_06170 [Segatella copri]|uniref:Uncharacterized protein n=2 Tax=Segatella copri TaxID=165179 RepID=A0AA92TYG8_9BACT|nr:hypothetical protein DWV76_06170 [Segatella copri]